MKFNPAEAERARIAKKHGDGFTAVGKDKSGAKKITRKDLKEHRKSQKGK